MVLVTIRISDLVKTYDIPIAAPQCPPPSMLNPVTGKCELQCTPPQFYNPSTGRCESIPTVLPTCTPPQVYNPVTGRCENPTPLPPPPTPPTPPPAPPTPGGKVINISTLTNAFVTQNIPILVSAVCVTPPAPINGEDATLSIDGNTVAVQTIINGIAQFTYVIKDAGLHKIQVTIPSSQKCPSAGSASLQIQVSPEIPSTLERLRIEEQARTAAEQQIAATRQQIRQLLTTKPTLTIPGV